MPDERHCRHRSGERSGSDRRSCRRPGGTAGRARRWQGLVVAALVVTAPATPGRAQGAAPARAIACAACHGADGRSAQPGTPSLAGQPVVFLENTLVMMREGLREVGAMKGLLDGVSDAELSQLARHYAALPPPPAAAGPRDATRAARGAALAQRGRCNSCHADDYRGREQMPLLAGQREDYLLAQLKLFRGGVTPGRDTIMSATLYGLGEAELADLAHYFAHDVARFTGGGRDAAAR